MQIKDIMTKNVISVSPDTGIAQVARTLSQYKIHGVPVMEGKHLVGIITETDFFTKDVSEIHLPTLIRLAKESRIKRKFFHRKDEIESMVTSTAKDIMTVECSTISPDCDVDELIALVRKNDLHTVPVVIGDLVVGMVTVADVVRLI